MKSTYLKRPKTQRLMGLFAGAALLATTLSALNAPTAHANAVGLINSSGSALEITSDLNVVAGDTTGNANTTLIGIDLLNCDERIAMVTRFDADGELKVCKDTGAVDGDGNAIWEWQSHQVIEKNIADSAVTQDKIKALAISEQHIQTDAVGGDQIRNDSIAGSKLNAQAISQRELGNNAVGTNHLQDSAVTNAKLANNAITTSKIQDGAVTKPKTSGLIWEPEVMAIVHDRCTAKNGAQYSYQSCREWRKILAPGCTHWNGSVGSDTCSKWVPTVKVTGTPGNPVGLHMCYSVPRPSGTGVGLPIWNGDPLGTIQCYAVYPDQDTINACTGGYETHIGVHPATLSCN